MAKNIRIRKDCYNTGNIFQKSSVSLNPGLTVLVGCNGSGKTTLLHQIDAWCNKHSIPSIVIDSNTLDRTRRSYLNMKNNNQVELFSTDLMSSEGEKMDLALRTISTNIGNFVLSKNKDAKELFILFDSLDSGMSIDYIDEIKSQLVETILSNKPNNEMDIYIIIAANSYEFARNSKCFDVTNFKYVDFNSYYEYRNYIFDTRKYKKLRYAQTQYCDCDWYCELD